MDKFWLIVGSTFCFWGVAVLIGYAVYSVRKRTPFGEEVRNAFNGVSRGGYASAATPGGTPRVPKGPAPGSMPYAGQMRSPYPMEPPPRPTSPPATPPPSGGYYQGRQHWDTRF